MAQNMKVNTIDTIEEILIDFNIAWMKKIVNISIYKVLEIVLLIKMTILM